MKKNFRLNWVDLLILVLMVGLVAGTYMKFRVSKTTNVVEPQTPITYQVQITNIRKTTVDALREGDALFDDDSGRKIGTIRSIEATPALTLAVDTNYNNFHYSIYMLNFINNSDSQIPEFYFHKIRKIYSAFIS